MTDSGPTSPVLRLGTRTSRLALWQAHYVSDRLTDAWPDLRVELVPFVTKGDKTLDVALPAIGGKGVFTAELERALREGSVDMAVHSLKDLPTDDPEGLTIGAIPPRGDARDAWVCPAGTRLEALRPGAVVGTSSPRRAAQILRQRPDLKVRSVRGNVETRYRKAASGDYDALVLAYAGLERLGMSASVTYAFDARVMLPAPGQGALGVQIRQGDEKTHRYLATLDHAPTRRAVEAERYLLAALGGGCSAPIGAWADEAGDTLRLRARILSPDGANVVEVEGEVDGLDGAAHRVGERVAERARAQGAERLLALARNVV